MGTLFLHLTSLPADLVLLLHALFIVFIIVGTFFIFAGAVKEIKWTRNLPFRLIHLLSMLFVTASAWVGWTCPLTHLENMLLREEHRYQSSFIQYWIQRLIYYDVEPWIFICAYSLFAGLIGLGWFMNPPKARSRKLGRPGSRNGHG